MVTLPHFPSAQPVIPCGNLRRKGAGALKLAAGLLALTSGLVCAASAEKPNIVFIIADDLGYGDLGCYGADKVRTPSIDRLATQGMRATDAHASAAVCTPSRYGILTGRNYWRLQNNWEGELLVEPDRPTVAKTLQEAGYATGYFGKWHLGWGTVDPAKPRTNRSDWDWNAETLAPGVMETGYDTFFGTPFSANEPPLVFVKDRTVVGRDPKDPLVIVDPKVEKYYGYGTSKGAAAAHQARQLDQIDRIVTGEAIKFISSQKGKPFYLHLAMVSPHVPIAPSKEFQGRSGAGAYGDYIEQMDSCVGEFLAALDREGLSDNTLVIFTSDNGAIFNKQAYATGHRSNSTLLGQKTDAWEGGVRVPFLARWPGKIPAGSVCNDLISLNDFYATACAVAGVGVPKGAAPDSVNQLPVLENPSGPPARTEMTYLAISKPPGVHAAVALRSGPWVFIPGRGSFGVTTTPSMSWAMQFQELGLENSDFNADGTQKPDAPAVQLYNLNEDLGQKLNLANRNPEKCEELASRLNAILKEERGKQSESATSNKK